MGSGEGSSKTSRRGGNRVLNGRRSSLLSATVKMEFLCAVGLCFQSMLPPQWCCTLSAERILSTEGRVHLFSGLH